MIRKPLAVILCLAVVRPAMADELQVLPDQTDGVKPAEMMHQYLMRRV